MRQSGDASFGVWQQTQQSPAMYPLLPALVPSAHPTAPSILHQCWASAASALAPTPAPASPGPDPGLDLAADEQQLLPQWALGAYLAAVPAQQPYSAPACATTRQPCTRGADIVADWMV